MHRAVVSIADRGEMNGRGERSARGAAGFGKEGLGLSQTKKKQYVDASIPSLTTVVAIHSHPQQTALGHTHQVQNPPLPPHHILIASREHTASCETSTCSPSLSVSFLTHLCNDQSAESETNTATASNQDHHHHHLHGRIYMQNATT